MSSELRANYIRRPTLADDLASHAEDVRYSSYGEAKTFILIVDTDERLRVFTYGFPTDCDIIEGLGEALKLVAEGK